MKITGSIRKIFLGFLFTIVPFLLFSCPVCRGGISKTEQDAYILTIVILGSLPLLIAGGLTFWIYRKYRNTKAGQA